MFRRVTKSVFAVALGFMALSAGFAFSNPNSGTSVSPYEALKRLMDGNKHYVKNLLTNDAKSGSATRISLANSQKPYAIILTCSDSRVPPEIVFDKGLGELFVVRVAGNISDPVVLGSIEYAAEHLGTTLIMVLGHERCGAVTAAVASQGKSTGSPNIDAIVKGIEPSIKMAVNDCPACRGEKDCAAAKKSEFVNCVIDTSAKTVVANLIKNSELLKHLNEEGKIRIVAAKYDLDDGIVTLFK